MSKITTAALDRDWLRAYGLPFALLLALMFALGACNTIAGAGEDVQAAGEGMSGAAESTEEEIEEEM